MDRRSFLMFSVTGVLAAPLGVKAQQTTNAQQSGKIFRVGILGTVPLTEPGSAHIWDGFFEGLRDLGYITGRNLSIESRFSEGQSERLPELAAELVGAKVDVIVAAAHAAEAAKQVTSSVPIVMANSEDPVERHLVASLARPGGNVTGLTGQYTDVIGKQLQLLTEVVPRLSRLAALSNPTQPSHRRRLRELQAAAHAVRIRVQVLQARAPGEFAAAVSAASKASADALFILGDPMFFGARTRIVELAGKSKLPMITIQSEYARVGGLLAYGIDQRDSFRRAAVYVDKILKGAKPADLPVEQPTKFELFVNLKTAKALGLTIPPSVLARADQVIE